MILGHKNNRDLYNNLLGKLIPDNIKVYVEPFGGMFGLYRIMQNKPKISIYNDINSEFYNNIKYEFINNKNVICFNIDYKEIIKYFDGRNTFFYIDPPYYGNEKYYENHTFLTKYDHIELSNIIKNIKGKFIISYQDRSLIRKLYSSYNIHKYTGRNMFHLPEIAITNH